MGNCTAVDSKESIVHMLQKGENSKLFNILAEYQDIYKSGYAVNSYGDTILHYAAALGNIDVVRWLCTNGADINTLNSHGWTPSDSAHFNSHSKVVSFLTSAGGTLSYFKNKS